VPGVWEALRGYAALSNLPGTLAKVTSVSACGGGHLTNSASWEGLTSSLSPLVDLILFLLVMAWM